MSHSIKNVDTLQGLSAYEIVSTEDLPDVSGFGIVLRHKKSGARVAVVSNEDNNKVFCIGFRTPPEDSTGVAHILEHSVLCGSERFPVKEPFVELVKGSLNTFLNAMTYPDKTIYPVASCNEKDFANLMEVYMDAVFFPDIYKHKEIFLQEGWHYELEDTEKPLVYNGVVYSEMKGAFSSPDQVLYAETQQTLFPDTAYGVESGGDPEVIPSLTYERFLEFHKRYYHPVNSYIYLYGDMDVRERLEWMDKEYLNRFEEISIASALSVQEPFSEKREAERFYSVNTAEEAENAAYFAYNVALGAEKDPVKDTAFHILCGALVNMPGTPVKQALTEAGIGEDAYAMYADDGLQPFFSIGASNAPEEKGEEFLRIVTETLAKCVREGINKKSLLAELNRMEFSCREADTGNYPKGLRYLQMMYTTWLYDDAGVFDNLHWSPVFDKLRELIATDYFERLLQESVLENPHGVFLKLFPKIGLQEEKDRKLAEQLALYKSGLTRQELLAMEEATRALKKYQEEPSTAEELATIPRLTREDLKKESDPIINEVKQMNGVTALHQELFSNGIAYVKLFFDMKRISAELLPYAGILQGLFCKMNTRKHSYLDLNNEININTGGLHTDICVNTRYDDFRQYSIHFVVDGKVLYGKIPELLGYMRELLTETVFDDTKRLREILLEQKSCLESRYSDMAHRDALKRATSYFTEFGTAMELTDGIAYYDFICELLADFENCKEELVKKLYEAYACVVARDVLTVSVTADAEGYQKVEQESETLFAALAGKAKGSGLVLVPEKKNEGFITPGQVQYVCCAGDFKAEGAQYTGAYEVLRTAMSYGYLWNNVRVKGGAYGAGFMPAENGRMAFVSWRDPHLARTMKVYEDAVEYIENFDADEAEMTKYVIGTMSSVDMPRNPRMEGERGYLSYFTGRTHASVQKKREEILKVTVEDIRALAAGVRTMLSQNCICTIGSGRKVREDGERFMQIKDLLH